MFGAMTPAAERRQMASLRQELNHDYEAAVGLDPPRSKPAPATYVMERRGVTRKELEAVIGSRARVSEVLNRRRDLTLEIGWRLHEAFGIPAETLIRHYDLRL